MRFALVALGLSALFCGCATIHPKIEVRHFGRLDPDRDAQVATLATSSRKAGTPVDQVEVVAGTLPTGLALEENGTKLVASAGGQADFEVLGEVEVDFAPMVQGAFFRNFYWTWGYGEGWRKGLCYPQAPLKLLTLGLWTILPLAWPCMASAPGDATERERALVKSIKHGVAAMGGNLAVVVNSGQMSYVTISGGRYSATGTVNTIKKTSLRAFAVRQRSRRDVRPTQQSGSQARAGTSTVVE